MTLVEEERLPPKIRDYGVQISENFILGIRNISDMDADRTLFNHSCSPNAGFKGQIFLVAMKNIQRGAEVTFDYGMVLHKSKGATPYKLRNFDRVRSTHLTSDNIWL